MRNGTVRELMRDSVRQSAVDRKKAVPRREPPSLRSKLLDLDELGTGTLRALAKPELDMIALVDASAAQR